MLLLAVESDYGKRSEENDCYQLLFMSFKNNHIKSG
jgi:hypothetical protein